MRFIIFVISLVASINIATAQKISLTGRVISNNKTAIEEALVSTIDGKYSAKTSRKGNFKIAIPKKYKLISITRLGYHPLTLKIDSLIQVSDIEIIMASNSDIPEVEINAEKLNASGSVKIDAKISTVMPSVNEGVESIIRTQAGVVGARNEMSSQYAVRGGNYDENLVYVNGIEVYRPKLIRSGNQEGLSFLNPLMVSSIRFSAGGFESKYGDNMSSVLDVKYKKPRHYESSISAGLLGASAFLQNSHFGGKLTHISSIRYKTNRFILKTLDTKGDYRPAFIDFQSFWNYQITRKLKLSFLVNVSDNDYMFYPESRRTTFGTISKSYGIFVGYNGSEKDQFQVYTGVLNLSWYIKQNFTMSLATSYTRANEYEAFDIEARYSLNELDNDLSSDNVGDSTLNLGRGMLIKHARNKLITDRFSAVYKANLNADNHYISWGVDWKYNKIFDSTEEWEMIDSAGYSIPYNNKSIRLSKSHAYEHDLTQQNISAYLQDKYKISTRNSDIEAILGSRLTYDSFSEELLFSPRFSMAYYSDLMKKHTFRFATGVYYRPPFYKSLKTFDGTINYNSKSQKSIHFVLSDEYVFTAFDRKLILNMAVYYKLLRNQIPFEVDNVSIKYYANQISDGYAAGLDFRVTGEFVPGVDSWLSLSLLKTEEDIKDIGNGLDDGYGYIPRPTDQFFNAALFLQDYLPMNKKFKAHINLVYGTPFVFGPPELGRQADTLKSSSYKRVDVGASMVLLRNNENRKRPLFRYVKSIWLTVELFNLLDIQNTVSYSWLKVVPNTALPTNNFFGQYATPNKLTGRMINLKLQIKF